MSKPRKRHANDAGYIAERMNPFVPDTKVVIYLSEEQGLNCDEGLKYSVVCDAHSELIGVTNMPMARHCMKNPDEFCDGCRALVELGK